MKRATGTLASSETLLVRFLLLLLVCVMIVGSALVSAVFAQTAPVHTVSLPSIVKAPVELTALAVDGTTLYVGENSTLSVVDVTDVAQPGQQVVLPLPQPAQRIIVRSPYIYVATRGNVYGPGTLTVIDVQQPNKPVIIRQISIAGVEDVVALGNSLFVRSCTQQGLNDTCLLSAFDISDPGLPRQQGTLQFALPFERSVVWAHMQVVGSHLYVAYGYVPTLCCSAAALEIVDVHDPSKMSSIGKWMGGGGLRYYLAGSLQVRNNIAYIGTLGVGQVIAIDTSNPASPVTVGTTPLSYGSRDVQAIGSTLYFTSAFSNTISLFDVSNADDLRVIGQVETVGVPTALRVEGARAYVIDSTAGVLIFDVSDPTQPRRLGIYAPL